MNRELYYNGSLIDGNHKKKRGFFFIEELFAGEFLHKAPVSLRKKLDSEDLENIETGIKCYFEIPLNSKIVFQNYTHFRRVLDEVKINLKQYYKK